MPPERNLQQFKLSAIQDDKKMKNHISNSALNQKVDNCADEGHNNVHKIMNEQSYRLLKNVRKLNSE